MPGYQDYLESLNQNQEPITELLIADFGARGWNPTQPDEQLVGTAKAPGANFAVAAAAPWASPDVHDADFWDGYMNKRNGPQAVGNPLAASSVVGLFKYVLTSVSASLNRILVAVCNGIFFVYNGVPVWTQYAMNGWLNALVATFAVMQNQLCIFGDSGNANPPLCPLWWDGASALGWLGNRLSPFYALQSGGAYYYAGIQIIAAGTGGSGPILTMTANQACSGLYVGQVIYIDNGLYFEPATVTAFTATGTQGAENYYVTSITLQNSLRYPAQNYTRASWNACTIVTAAIGGTITTTGDDTTILLMAVTDLKSGGQRASIFSIDVPNGTTNLIALENLTFAGGSGQIFGTDLPQNATSWYMTQPFNPQTQSGQSGSGPSQIFYQIPATDSALSNGLNPMPNNQGTMEFFESPDPDTWETLIAATGVDAPGYFTGQIDVPLAKIAVPWQNMLCAARDPWNKSRLWISAFGAPHVWGTQGGLDGAYIDIPNADDGQEIVSLFVGKNGLLYVGKTNSLYAVYFNGNTTLTPFQVTQCSGSYGPISPDCFEETDQYIYYLSTSGLCAVSMYTVQLLPANSDIRAKFNGINSWNLDEMAQSQSLIIPTKQQIHFQAAAVNRGDQTLIYDWVRNNFTYKTAGPTAKPSQLYTALCEDVTSSPAETYAGDGNGQVWLLDVPGEDEVVPIDFHYETPWLNGGDPGMFKTLQYIWVGGKKQVGPATLNVLIYTDFKPKPKVVTFDMSNPGFELGYNGLNPVQLGIMCKYFKIVFVQNTAGVPVSIRFMRIKMRIEGDRL